MKLGTNIVLVALCAALLPAAALAHPGQGGSHDLIGGFMHPLSGIDHLLAMLAVGIFAAQLGGKAIWQVPFAFVVAMMGGGALGYFGVPLPMVEQGIGLSVIVLGLAVMVGVRLPTWLAMGLVGLFAGFHGHAHGSEGALAHAFLPYAAGFVAATSLLHFAGVVLGLSLDRLGSKTALLAKRVLGAAGAVAGAAILVV